MVQPVNLITDLSAKVFQGIASMRRVLQNPNLTTEELRLVATTALDSADLLNQSVNDLPLTIKQIATVQGVKP